MSGTTLQIASNQPDALPQIDYLSPTICCRCGQREGTSLREVKSSLKKKTTKHGFGEATFQMRINVPICAPCHQRLGQITKNENWAVVAGVMVATIATTAALLFFQIQEGWFWTLLAMGLVLVMMVATFFVTWFMVKMLNHGESTQMGVYDFDGEYFHFCNEAFQRQFAALNPNLVNPHHTEAGGGQQKSGHLSSIRPLL